MLPLDLLGMRCARAVHVRIPMPGICSPMIGIKAREPAGLQQRFAWHKDCIFATTKDIGQNGSCVMMLGKDKAQYLVACFLILPV